MSKGKAKGTAWQATKVQLARLELLENRLLAGEATDAEAREFRGLAAQHGEWIRRQPWFKRFAAADNELARLRSYQHPTEREQIRMAVLRHILVNGGSEGAEAEAQAYVEKLVAERKAAALAAAQAKAAEPSQAETKT